MEKSFFALCDYIPVVVGFMILLTFLLTWQLRLRISDSYVDLSAALEMTIEWIASYYAGFVSQIIDLDYAAFDLPAILLWRIGIGQEKNTPTFIWWEHFQVSTAVTISFYLRVLSSALFIRLYLIVVKYLMFKISYFFCLLRKQLKLLLIHLQRQLHQRYLF